MRRNDLGYSVSCTTRPPRPAESTERYFFLTPEAFLAAREKVSSRIGRGHQPLYGTLRREVDGACQRPERGMASTFREHDSWSSVPEAVLVFILPPNAEVSGALKARGTERCVRIELRTRWPS